MDNMNDYYSLIKKLQKQLPKREDGRIDYSHAKIAAVVTIFIRYKDKILLLKRSDQVLTYKGKWNTVAGYLDDLVPIEQKIEEELLEELCISRNDIKTIEFGDSYSFFDINIQKTWVIFPVLVSLVKKPLIILDWEHTEYRWVDPNDIGQYDTVINAKESLERALYHFKGN
jgi:isopentenyldiphosphate isomerase